MTPSDDNYDVEGGLIKIHLVLPTCKIENVYDEFEVVCDIFMTIHQNIIIFFTITALNILYKNVVMVAVRASGFSGKQGL